MPEVEAIELRLLLEAIFARYGYDLRDYAQASLARRVLVALERTGLPHIGALQHHALHNPQVFATLLDTLAVRVSALFRDPPFFAAFRAQVVPVLKTYPALKIWHCGCAGGEEVYSLAIVLREEGLYDRTQIYATDMSADAIAQAKLGIYAAPQLQLLARDYAAAGGQASLADYYTEGYGGIAMRESLRQNVLFFQHNVVSDHTFGEMQVILCRNVLIYFSEDLRGRVLEKFAQSLGTGGFVCLGSSERMRAQDPFHEVVAAQRIYRR